MIQTKPQAPSPTANKGALATDFLRFFAIALIVNSHMEHFYPIPQLAADGFLGNSIFFSLSGVGLALSKSNQKLSFGPWFWRRLTRIYPSLLIVVGIFIILLDNQWGGTPLGFVRLAIWPTQFGFITQLLVFYIPYYFVSKLDRKYFRLLFSLLFIPFLTTYFSSLNAEGLQVTDTYLHPLNPMNWIFYFQMMVLGGLVAKEISLENPFFTRMSNEYVAFGSFIAASFAYVLVKALIVLNLLQNYYYLLNLFIIIIIASLFLISMNRRAKDFLSKPIIEPTVTLIASLTLEIYLVHVCLLKFSFFSNFIFPFNIIMFVAFSVLFAFLVQLVALRIQARLRVSNA